MCQVYFNITCAGMWGRRFLFHVWFFTHVLLLQPSYIFSLFVSLVGVGITSILPAAVENFNADCVGRQFFIPSPTSACSHSHTGKFHQRGIRCIKMWHIWWIWRENDKWMVTVIHRRCVCAGSHKSNLWMDIMITIILFLPPRQEPRPLWTLFFDLLLMIIIQHMVLGQNSLVYVWIFRQISFPKFDWQ